MIRRSPCEYYLKYLLTHPDGYSEETIRRLIKVQQLDFLGMPYLLRLRDSVVVPDPFYPEDERHRPSNKFLRKEKLESIYRPDDDMVSANTVLEKPRIKEAVEAMVITGSNPQWVSLMLKQRFGVVFTEKAIELYCHYYFKSDIVDSTELRALMLMRGVSDATTDPDEQRQAEAYFQANKADPRHLSAQMSVTPLANIMTTMRMGILPTNLELQRVVTAAQAVASIGSLEASMRGLPERARDFALTAKMMTEIAEQVGTADDDLQQGLGRLMMANDETKVPYIDDLSRGNHTLDVMPLGQVEVHSLPEVPQAEDEQQQLFDPHDMEENPDE